MGDFIRRIDNLQHEITAHFRQSYVTGAQQGRGESIRDGHNRSMARLLHEIRERL